MISVVLSVAVSMSGCQTQVARGTEAARSKPQTTLKRSSFARILMGSRCTIVLYAPDEASAAGPAEAAFDEIARIERVLTDYDPKSEAMTATTHTPGQWRPISTILLDVLLQSRDIHNRTDGAFDPTVGAYTHLWRLARREGKIPTPAQLKAAGVSVGFEHLRLDPINSTLLFDAPGIVLDFGGIGKGYAAQSALDLLARRGFTIATVDIGGDLALGDPPPDQPEGWRVEIATGLDASRDTYLANCAVATSGDLERFYEHGGVRYSHILDPRTGMGIAQRRAATVIAPDGATADALASAISVLGQGRIDELESRFPAVRINLQTRSLSPH